MGFTTPCFIRKNTPELRKKLEDIGHVRYPYEFADWDDDRPDRKYIIIDVLYYTYGTKPTRKPKKGGDFIDCDDNEELFLALAALRDDSDYMQWFISPKTRPKISAGYCGQIVGMDGHSKEIVGYEWYRHENKDNALTERLNAMVQMESEDMEFEPHKATVEELIEHFKR